MNRSTGHDDPAMTDVGGDGGACLLGSIRTKYAAPVQQYAALPWRQVRGLQILVITSRQTRRWIIPKGWPVPGLSPAESAAQEAYEEAGVRGKMTTEAIGQYGYSKRLRGGAKNQFRVEVFAMEVTEILAFWPEATERTRHWLSPAEAAVRVNEPELAVLIRTFAADQLEQPQPAPTVAQAILERLTALFRFLGLRSVQEK